MLWSGGDATSPEFKSHVCPPGPVAWAVAAASRPLPAPPRPQVIGKGGWEAGPLEPEPQGSLLLVLMVISLIHYSARLSPAPRSCHRFLSFEDEFPIVRLPCPLENVQRGDQGHQTQPIHPPHPAPPAAFSCHQRTVHFTVVAWHIRLRVLGF